MYSFTNNSIIKHTILILSACMLAACSVPKDIAYIQDKTTGVAETFNGNTGIEIQPQDMLDITVSSSRSPELAVMFNLSSSTTSIGSEIMGSGQNRITGYVVDNEGCIDFPVLGTIQVAGMNRWALASKIKEEILGRGLLSDAVVTVEFMNFKISVIGEVNSPGTYTISGDKVTILQGLALARDLTIFGKRTNVSVIREENGQRIIYNLDLTSSNLFTSPAYYLKQNDVIMVEPSDIKKRQSTVDDKNLRITSIAISTGSLLLTVVNLIINLAK